MSRDQIGRNRRPNWSAHLLRRNKIYNNTAIARAQPTDAEIDEIYTAYPKHVAKPAAKKAIRAALRQIAHADLLAAVREFAAAKADGEKRFIPNCATWMNQERWTDDRSEWRDERAGRRISPGVAHDPTSTNGRPVATEGFH